jgi:Cu/Ag efflux protein CusF
MLRFTIAAVGVLLVWTGANWADDHTGKIKNLDIKKNTITVTTDDADLTLPLAKDVSVFYERKPMKKQPGGLEPVPGGLNGLKTGNTVTITTEKKDERETVSLIKLENADQKPDKKKKE